MSITTIQTFPYSADLTAGSLKVPESRIIADLLLCQCDDMAWKTALEVENRLQVRSLQTAKRLTRLIRHRLETMTPELWQLVRDGNGTTATHACLAATVKQSRLVAEFLSCVLREQYRCFATVLDKHLWDDYIEDCFHHVPASKPDRPFWTESTIRRLRSSMFQILEQAGYIENTNSMRLQSVYIAEDVIQYLRKNNENHILHCIQLT